MKPFRIIDVPQRSPEWFAARLGRLTGSTAKKMLATVAKGEAADRRNLRMRLVLERLTGRSQENDYVSPAMQAGIDREPDARSAYELLTGNLVLECGFLAHAAHMAGCSLDGYMGDFDALMSIKCRQPAAHYEAVKTGKVPADAFAQIRHELWVTGARSHDYFSWNPDFPERLRSKLVTVTREQADIPGYEREALKFLAECDAVMEEMQSLAVEPVAVGA